MGGAVVVRHDVVVDIAGPTEAAAADAAVDDDGEIDDDAEAVLEVEGGDSDEEIAPVQETLDDQVVGRRSSAECSSRIDCFGKASVAGTESSPESHVERDAE